MTYTLRIASTVAEFAELETIWSQLLADSPSNNYFLRWEWLWHWWNVFAGPDDRLAILLLEKKDKIAAIAPFYVRKRFLGGIYPVRRMMFIGTQEDGDGDVGSDYMDVLYRSGEENSVINAIFKGIVSHDICDEIYLSNMDTAAKTYHLVREEAENRHFITMIADTAVSPSIKLPSTWDEYLNSLTPSMRYKIRNERRKVEKNGGAAVIKVENVDDLPKGFEELSRLHAKRWEARGREGVFAQERFAQFHRGIMPTMLKKGHLELSILSENGANKAVIYNILYNNKVYFYQSGVDTADRKTAYGYVLHSYCIEEAIKKGMTEYDFLPKGAGDDYKDRFSTQSRSVADIYMACQWAVKRIVQVRESARFVYHRMKPHLMKVNERVKMHGSVSSNREKAE
jgi:CelD/BcsL family acetyltransferase involved in cellulose biosynthesis